MSLLRIGGRRRPLAAAPLLLSLGQACVLAGALTAVPACADRSLAPSSPLAPAEGYPRDVVGADGQTLHLLDRPRRVMPLNAAAYELTRALIGPERVAALPATVAEFANSSVFSSKPLDSTPSGGDSMGGQEEAGWATLPTFAQLEGEQLVAFEPDCVIAHSWQASAGLGTLRRLGVLVVEIPDITRFEVILDAVRILGEVLGEEQKATALIAQLQRRRESLHDPARSVHRVMTYGNFGSGGWTAGKGTTADVAITLSGLRNAAAEAGLNGNTTLELERLLDLDPDVLVIAQGGVDDVWSPTRKVLDETPELQHLRAVKEGRVVEIPTALYGSTSHTLMDFAEALAAAVDALED